MIAGSGRSPGGMGYTLQYSWASLVAQRVKNLPAMQKTWIRSLGNRYGKGTGEGRKEESREISKKLVVPCL